MRVDPRTDVRVDSRAFAGFATALSGTATFHDLAAATVDRLPRLTGASHAVVVWRNSRQGLQAVACSPPGYDETVTSLDGDDPLAGCARTGDAAWVDDVQRKSGGGLGSWFAGAESFCALPLQTADALHGALGLAFPERRAFSADDRTALFEVADLVAAGLQRARMFDSEQYLRKLADSTVTRLDRLQTVTARLSTACTSSEVAEVILGHGIIEIGAAAGAIFGLNPADQLLAIGAVGEMRDGDQLEMLLLATRSVRTGEPSINRQSGDRSCVAIPLTLGRECCGALVLRFPADAGVEGAELQMLQVLGSLTAQALDRARLYQQRVDEARALQQSLLPPDVSQIDGLQFASRYRPFGDGSVVGGDFYDVVKLSGDRWGVVFGDVCGKGVKAATLTAMARHTLRTALRYDGSPSRVLELLNQQILDAPDEERYCTGVVAMLERSGGDVALRIASGGHPPPLLRTSAGTEAVAVSGSAVGLFADPRFTDVEVRMRMGDVLMFYTDGLTEARSRSGALAGDLVEQVLAGTEGRSAEEIADAVIKAVEAFQGGVARDDMALLVVRVPGGDEG